MKDCFFSVDFIYDELSKLDELITLKKLTLAGFVITDEMFDDNDPFICNILKLVFQCGVTTGDSDDQIIIELPGYSEWLKFKSDFSAEVEMIEKEIIEKRFQCKFGWNDTIVKFEESGLIVENSCEIHNYLHTTLDGFFEIRYMWDGALKTMKEMYSDGSSTGGVENRITTGQRKISECA